jgi:uncharacterized protein (DUF2062 family)
VDLAIRRPAIGPSVLLIAAEAAIVGLSASSDGAIIAAVIAGVFTLVNTGLTLWLTDRARPRRRRRRRRRRARPDRDE